jgi:aminoglycoside 6'-N-acetyltransferase I
MKNLQIKPLEQGEAIPFELLLSADPSRKAIMEYLPYSDIYLAFISDKLIGVYVLCRIDTYTIEIKNIAVAEAYQGLGIGKSLLEDATQTAIKGGYRFISIGTSNASIGQLYLYQKQGFELSGIKMNFFIDNYPEPIFENGIQCKHMLMLTKELTE